MAAEDVLHDLGAISMMSSDSQAMGRVGEVICRTWQTAHKMRDQRGRLPEEQGDNDNLRIRRYVASIHDQSGDSPWHRARGRLRRGWQTCRSGALEAGLLRRQSRDGDQRRLHRLGPDGRRERVDSNAAAADDAADVRCVRPGDAGAPHWLSSRRRPSTLRRCNATGSPSGSRPCAGAEGSASAT